MILIVYGADGTVLQSDHAGSATFSGVLPSTQDYLIDVRSMADDHRDHAALHHPTALDPERWAGQAPRSADPPTSPERKPATESQPPACRAGLLTRPSAYRRQRSALEADLRYVGRVS